MPTKTSISPEINHSFENIATKPNTQDEVIAFRIASEGTVKDVEFIKVAEEKEQFSNNFHTKTRKTFAYYE